MMLSPYAILLPFREWTFLKIATDIVQNQDGQEPFKPRNTEASSPQMIMQRMNSRYNDLFWEPKTLLTQSTSSEKPSQ